jgi:hypothetical protein
MVLFRFVAVVYERFRVITGNEINDSNVVGFGAKSMGIQRGQQMK